MRLSYTIEIIPTNKTGYWPWAHTEGPLEVWQGENLFLRAEGVLLIEFAVELEYWRRKLARGEVEDLYYASMDFEEEPIFALYYDPASGDFTPGAVWAEGEGVPVCPGVAEAAFASYIERLGCDLAREGIVLAKELETYVKENDDDARPRR